MVHLWTLYGKGSCINLYSVVDKCYHAEFSGADSSKSTEERLGFIVVENAFGDTSCVWECAILGGLLLWYVAFAFWPWVLES
jgi:hypothetical protein